MAGVKISALPAIVTPALTDIFPEVQPASGGVTYKATFNQLMALYQKNLVTPANGGILYTDATQIQLLAPTATANQLLMSGANSAPHWSTPTYPTASGTAGQLLRSNGTNNVYSTFTIPDTALINTMLYASSANVYGSISPVNSALLISSSGGVPSWSNSAIPAFTMAGALNMGTHLINNVVDPVSAQDAATKAYVDATATGLTIQGACRLATTTALTVTYANGVAGVGATLTNAGAQVALTIDGVAAVVNDRILVKNQASALQNGIYTVTNIGSGATNWIMTRATDYDQASEVNPGDLVIITAGNTLASSSWIETATVNTIGVDSINFSQFSASLPVSVPNGGTGNTTFTAYSVICAGTTATGAFQNVSGLGTAGFVLTSAGAGALPVWAAPATSGTVTSVSGAGLATGTVTTTGSITVTAASSSDQVTGTSTSVAVVPGVQSNHPSAAKIWALFACVDGSINSAYHVTSVTKNATGDFTVNFSITLGNGNYATVLSPTSATSLFFATYVANTQTTTALRILTFNTSFSAADPANVSVAIFCNS